MIADIPSTASIGVAATTPVEDKAGRNWNLPHPGDILYWAVCAAGLGLLLLVAF